MPHTNSATSFRKVFILSAITLLIIVVPLSYWTTVYQGSKKIIATNPIPSNAPRVEIETEVLPLAKDEKPLPSVETMPLIRGKSLGVFYPSSEGAVINNQLPTISGKIYQNDKLIIDPKFGLENSIVNDELVYTLRFEPGKLQNIKLFIDNIELPNIYGIPQYPLIDCENIIYKKKFSESKNKNTTIIHISEDEYNSVSACLLNTKNFIPPVIFYTKPSTPLVDGKHILSIEYNGNTSSMVFYVDSKITSTRQILPKISTDDFKYISNEFEVGYFFVKSDTCGPGYYQPVEYQKFPLPRFDSNQLLYTLSIPSASSDLNRLEKKKAVINFDGNTFDIFFPSYYEFYKNDSRSYTYQGDIDPFFQLFVPIGNLKYENNQSVKFTSIYDMTDFKESYSGDLFYILPFDLQGGIYPKNAIPWVIATSSGCDG